MTTPLFEKFYIEILKVLDEKKACWKGYKQLGIKSKGGKKVPNCVPIKEAAKCTGPTQKTQSDRKGKKWMRCVPSDSGGYKRIHWGQAGVKVGGGNSKRAKSFRARHKCGKAKANTPQGQACRDWK